MKLTSVVLALLATTTAFGSDSEGETWSLDASLRLGGVENDLTSEDESFYGKIPLVVRDEKGRTEPLKVSTTPTGFDLSLLGAIDRPWRLGLGIGYRKSESYASNASSSANARPFMEQYTASLRGRWLPMIESMKGGGSIRMEVDAALGGTMGTLHRYALAADQLESKPDSVSKERLRYFRDGSRPVDIRGVHTECIVNAVRQWENGVRLGAGAGLTYQIFWLDQDPLGGVELDGRMYPRGPEEYGLLIRLVLGYAI